MNFEKVTFGFCILLALTLNFGFFIGDFDNPAHVADIQLIAAAVIWGMTKGEMSGETMASIVSLSGGALVANFVSAVLLIAETITERK